MNTFIQLIMRWIACNSRRGTETDENNHACHLYALVSHVGGWNDELD